MTALAKDADAAGEQYGNRAGNSPYAFPVTVEGVAGKVKDGTLPVKVKGVPKDVAVSVQVGPALPGTAIRDAVGFIEFGQFVNQVEYADAATALNSQVKAQVLEDLDPASLEGKKVEFLGAFTLSGADRSDDHAREAGGGVMSVATEPVMRARGINKVFGATHALRGVDFDVVPGQRHGAVRRERRRQVDADEDPRRDRAADHRRARARRRAGRARRSARTPPTAASRSSTRSSACSRT